MTVIDLPSLSGPAKLRLLICGGFVVALVAAMIVTFPFEVSRECRGGAFSAAFSRAFDVRRCYLVVRRGADVVTSIELPQDW
jgi:hypothetical protein